MHWSHCLALLIAAIFAIFVKGQVKHPFEAVPIHYDEYWSHYDKCHFFDRRNRFWNYHHCEYVDCSYDYNNTCSTEAIYGRWPVMVTRYSDGCSHVHIRVPVAPSTSCWPGKMMTMCCTFMEDPTRVVSVLPFHARNTSESLHRTIRYWPYEREHDMSVTWGPQRPPVPTYSTPQPHTSFSP